MTVCVLSRICSRAVEQLPGRTVSLFNRRFGHRLRTGIRVRKGDPAVTAAPGQPVFLLIGLFRCPEPVHLHRRQANDDRLSGCHAPDPAISGDRYAG